MYTGVRSDGFTMIELVVTMIIIGILAVSILPRFDSLGSFDAAGFADQTQSLLRYAQKSAIAQRRWVAVDVGATPPTLCSQTVFPTCAAACAGGTGVTPIALPGGSAARPRASTSFKAGSSTVLCFDALGRPLAAGSAVPLTVAASLTVMEGAADFRTITVEPETGYVH
ncbi:MAG TPA: type II secretion system protein [Rhodocyclaceae bacterium]|nr:type II secretion system protein [Rhodocyclaceae bacterium]